jgi:ABC-type amino acid transport substrate-binding protein
MIAQRRRRTVGGKAWSLAGLARAVLLAAGLTGVWGAGASRAEDPPPLVVAVLAQTPPFSLRREDGTLAGFNVDIARGLCKGMAVACQITELPFVDVLPALEAGRVDFAVANILKTPARAERIDFTDHYWRSTSSFVGPVGQAPGFQTAGLAGRRIGVQKGTVQERWLRRQYAGTTTILAVDTAAERIALLTEGRVDAVLAPTLAFFDFLASEAGQGFTFLGEAMMADNLGGPVCIGLPKGRDALRTALNMALKAMLRRGDYDAISRRYFPISIY